MKRIKIVRDKPNRLFETWLEEWKNEAIHRKSDLWKHFAKALDSLKRYPLPLESGRDCIILQHFGTKLCSMLDRKLEEYRKQESNNAVNCIAVVSNDENYTKKTSTEENQITSETQEKAIIIKQASNKKKNITEKLVNVNEIVSKHTDRQICFEPDIFDIILLVDTQETSGGKTKFQYDATLVELTQLGVSFEVRRLKVGDFAWIAKCKKTNDELVIPYIVERKRIDDLSASITDGRFHEQKDKRLFGCKKEQLIQTNYINGTINLMEFKEFNKSSSKQRTFKVSEMFIRQLLQLKGMSVDKVMAIVKHYATPEVLIASLQSCDENGEQLLASIQVGDKKRQLGHVISKTIYQLYMTNELS
ncbi:crossover junction endonuclease MUS81 isoform X2 [Harpegnathos saltator]|uniref:crossover junction endonuclease MUS81 isoform X2 n=1 Tax=Harpegnathos saltator TaxID=610380 RepID=UPI00058E0AC3|nr:crossover junction endonuclease MUS81 isoform X2 [Harpegnathos saltator]